MEIQTFSPLQAEMLILLGNIEQYAEQGRHLSAGTTAGLSAKNSRWTLAVT